MFCRQLWWGVAPKITSLFRSEVQTWRTFHHRIRATFHGVDTNDDAALLNLERVAERSALEAGTLTALEIPTEVKRVK